MLFIDNRAAAKSLKNAWTRMASTYHCIRVSLDHDQLVVRPRPAISWLISILCLDLNHAIPLTSITGVRLVGKWGEQKIVQVSFLGSEGRVKEILLYLHGGDDFARWMGELNLPVTTVQNSY